MSVKLWQKVRNNMADIELVIKIDEQTYNEIKDGFYDNNVRTMAIAIGNGTPLPKGHGELVDIRPLMRG